MKHKTVVMLTLISRSIFPNSIVKGVFKVQSFSPIVGKHAKLQTEFKKVPKEAFHLCFCELDIALVGVCNIKKVAKLVDVF